MQALILAAGEGRRLLPLTADLPKCLVPIAGRPILEWQIAALRGAGVKRISIVTGAHGEKVRKHVLSLQEASNAVWPWEGIKTTHNPEYKVSNVLESFAVGLGGVDENEDLIVMAGDVVFDPIIMKRLVSSTGSDIFLCVNQRVCGEEEVKLIKQGEEIVRLGKKLDPKTAYGEFLGVFRVTRERIADVRQTAVAILGQGERQAYLFDMINRLIDGHGCTVRGLETGDLTWEEIDFPEDVARAEKRFAPAAQSGAGPGRTA